MELTEQLSFDNHGDLSYLEEFGVETEGVSSAYVVTYTPYFLKSVKNELNSIDESVKVKPIADSIALVTSTTPQDKFFKEVQEESPIFLKHIMPVMDTGNIIGNLEEDKEKLLESADKVVDMEAGSKFAVQCRVVGGKLEYSAKDIEVYIGENYYKKGFIPTFSDKQILNDDIFVISILISGKTFLTGFSKSSENLNFHSDEARISSRAGGREISRAENKLKEALATFKVELEGNGTALDLGAAPGGWSKVLADYGYNVLAVDPAELHPDLQNNPKIHHLKLKSEDLHIDKPLDLIVNDMNMDPQKTAKIMNDVSHLLGKDGLAIVTLKLPNTPRKSIEEAVVILGEKYDVLKIRSLFHNRQEVTALLKKKER